VSPSGLTCLFWLAYAVFLDAPHSEESLWTSDQPVAETSTWQHTTLTTDEQTNIHAPGGIRTHNLSRQAAEDHRAATGIGREHSVFPLEESVGEHSTGKRCLFIVLVPRNTQQKYVGKMFYIYIHTYTHTHTHTRARAQFGRYREHNVHPLGLSCLMNNGYLSWKSYRIYT
jgi:hypothetical protein